jgi:hypothetical protein
MCHCTRLLQKRLFRLYLYLSKELVSEEVVKGGRILDVTLSL